MKSLVRALCAICILLTCASCEKWKNCAFDLLGSDTPYFEGGDHKHFDSKEQKHSFRIITGCGKTYRYNDSIRFEAIWRPDQSRFITSDVDTLANGDFRISYDWATFKLTDNRSVIEVEVGENKTGQERELSVGLSHLGKHLYKGIRLTITQGAE